MSSNTSTNTRTIVVVDDDAGMSQAIERLLNAAGFRALTFPCAEALLESEAQAVESASCLVVDVHLPGLSGFELRERLRVSGPTPPVVFITAYDDAAGRAHARQIGAIAYFTKPFSGHALLAAIDQAITSARTKTQPNQP